MNAELSNINGGIKRSGWRNKKMGIATDRCESELRTKRSYCIPYFLYQGILDV